MSEQVPQEPIVSRRTLLIAAAAAAGLSVAGCESLNREEPAAPNSPHAPLATPTPSPSHTTLAPNKNDPLDLSRLPNGPLRAFPWRYELDPAVPGYNNEAQVYDNKHAVIDEGTLTIEAVRANNGYRSSRIDTMNRWSFTNGRITAVAKLPKGVGTWPALWLLPDERQTPRVLARHGIHDTPDSDLYYAWGGEIDMVEAVGWENKPVSNHTTLHTHASIAAGSDTGISEHVQPVTNAQTSFHEYSLTKRKGIIEFGLDGRTVHGIERQHGDTLADWPFDDYPYYFIANLAMGGTWGGHMKSEFPPNGIDDSKAPWKLQIAELHFQPL